VLVAWNKSSDDAGFELAVSELADGDYRDGLSGAVIQVRGGKTAFRLPGQSSAFFVKK
jgi:hypothetical protein